MNLTQEQKIKLDAAIDKWLDAHRDEYIEDVKKVCRVRSVSGEAVGDLPFGEGCKEMLDMALQLSEEYGFKTKNYDNWAGSATYGDNPNGDSIGIVAHMDIVPEGNGWTHDPYDPYVSDCGKYIFGRGTADNKGPAMVGLYAMRFLKDHDIKLKNNVMLVYGLNEEKGSADMPQFLKREKAPKWSLVPDSKFPVGYAEIGFIRAEFAIPEVGDELVEIVGGEATNSVPDRAYAIVSGCKLEDVKAKLGDMERITVEEDEKGVRFNATGNSQHASRPEGAVNANNVLAKAILKAEVLTGKTLKAMELFEELTSYYWGEPFGIGCEDDISGKLTCVFTWVRKVGDKLMLKPDVRYPVKADQEYLMKKFPEAAAEKGLEILAMSNNPAFCFPLDHPVVEKLIEIPREVLGMPDIPPICLAGGTYARSLPNAVSYGVTVPDRVRLFGFEKGGAHQADEYGDIPNLMRSIRVFIHTLIEIDDLVAEL
ncbi:MAG: Sapep family Mn(2+)-dependent dipeptidase [Oscillospiraceae bacterium]|nr:Sapep family Mn(2+)-dependent dipeptidase [Oscillospiraceae bacterium]